MPSDVAELEKRTQESLPEWFAGKEFTKDWTTNKLSHWVPLLSRFRDAEVDVLEVGSFEGRSAVFLLNFLPQAKITCVDLFKAELDGRFDTNLQGMESRVEKRKGSAIGHLDALSQAGRKFHLIYQDAAKSRDLALIMSLLAWPMLQQNGIMFWDDYEWGKGRAPEDRPHDGIDAFLEIYADKIEILFKERQVFIRKL